MSVVRNRELSQFGSFIHIDDQSRSIGITTGPTPNVGIGTTNPSVKFEVVGDTNIGGNLTVTGGSINASSLILNGDEVVDAAIDRWSSGTGSDIYRLDGNIGIGTSVTTQKLTVLGNVSAGQFISTVTSGTAPFQVLSDTVVTNLNASRVGGKSAPSGDIVGTTDTQTLTNKTLTSPRISSIVNGSFTSTIPSVNGTLVSTGSTGVVTSNMIADLNIVNADVAVGAGIVYSKLNLTGSITNADIASGAAIAVSKLASSTISGVSLGNNLNNLTFNSYLTASSSYNGSSAVSVSVAATSLNTGNTVVARDELGNFTGGTITASDFNSTSDKNLKENIQTVENALETVSALRGVSFDWKETGKKSYGVIAQELEVVLPQLVNDGEIKSVNYNGLIGVLIEAVKELSAEVQELKAQLNN